MREIILDTETTGFKPDEGHRIVEIGCMEVYQNLPTGKSLQIYINPERDMPAGAFKVHGISEEFLADKPLFADVVDEFLEFIGEAPLVIHNARFDMTFLNAELRWAGKPALKNKPIDTVTIAREFFPGSPVNLDALCRRFEIDNSSRSYHGALLDCELLAEVYLELRGGRQHGFDLGAKQRGAGTSGLKSARTASGARAGITVREVRPHSVSEEELAAHKAMLETLSDPLWNK